MLRESSSRYLSTERSDDAVLRATFCADPRPLKVSWRWGSFQLEAGTGSGRFVAEALHKVIPSSYDHMSPDVDVVERTDIFDEEPKLGTGKLTQLTAPALYGTLRISLFVTKNCLLFIIRIIEIENFLS